MKASIRMIGVAAAIASVVSSLPAQSLSLGLRGSGSFPTGGFSQQDQAAASSALIQGAKSGFGYGLDAAISLGFIGVYAGFDHINFDCQTSSCRTDGKYTLQGVTAGVKLSPMNSSMLRPFIKAGVTFNDLQGGYGGSSSNVLTTETAPGYEVGVGLDVNLLGVLSFAPQARYVGQNLKAKIPGVNAPAATGDPVNYFTVDLGLALHTPFGR
jgi:outer membrane protein with beta-barrel domain